MLMSFYHNHLAMVDHEPRVDSIYEDVDCKSCKCSPYNAQLYVQEDQLNCRNMEVFETGLLRADIDISSDEADLNSLVLEELENLHIEQTLCSSTSNKMISQISSHNAKELLDLSKCATMLCSEDSQPCPAKFAKTVPPTVELGCESSLSHRNAAEDGMPLHAPQELVSALKGSRAHHGKPLDRNLHVKWAADVYDPPVTSSSHTVKGHHHHNHHRPVKAKKDHHKHKHAKSRPSNTTSSSSERRSFPRRNSSSGILDPRMSRWQALSSISLQSGVGRLKMQQVLEESKYGGSFHAETPWPFSLPVAEASS